MVLILRLCFFYMPSSIFYYNEVVERSFILKLLSGNNSSILDGAKIGIFYTKGVFRTKKTGYLLKETACFKYI